jgi:hypothetical protein
VTNTPQVKHHRIIVKRICHFVSLMILYLGPLVQCRWAHYWSPKTCMTSEYTWCDVLTSKIWQTLYTHYCPSLYTQPMRDLSRPACRYLLIVTFFNTSYCMWIWDLEKNKFNCHWTSYSISFFLWPKIYEYIKILGKSFHIYVFRFFKSQ